MMIDCAQHVTSPQPDDFPALFKSYIMRSVQAALARVEVHAYSLPDEARARALHVLDYAFKLPEAWPHTRELLLAMLPRMEQVGHGKEWMDCLTQSAHYGEQCGDIEAAAEFSWQLGYLYRRQSQFDQAREWLQASRDCFTQIGQLHGKARALNELAFVAILQHNYKEANQLAEASLSLLDETDPERAMSYRTQGMIAIDHESWQEAEDLHRKALHLSEKLGDQHRIAWHLQNLGYALRGQERFAEAIACFERAAAMLAAIHDTYHWAIVQLNVGVTYRFNDKPDAALACHVQAAKIFHKIGDKLNLAKLYTNLGLDYLVKEEWTEAEQAFRLSIDLYADLGDEGWRLNAVDGLTMTYLSQKLYAKAIAVLEPAIAALPGIVDMPNYGYLQRSLTEHLRKARVGLADVHEA